MTAHPFHEFGIQAVDNMLRTCGPHTGHIETSIAFCDTPATAAFLARSSELVAELRDVLSEMLDRQKARYDQTEEGQQYFRENNAKALAVLEKVDAA